MKTILAIPVLVAKAVADLLFGTDEITETMKQERYKAQLMMVMGRTH
ncbi:MAG TPA: hypothetical protein VD973_06925 [Symbiobacteriaceae bacterium]|jgi:hypothetical protein|nr:hypothetical protein [Symbiobacteriaceae bacterium]